MTEAELSTKRMRLRYAGTCVTCSTALAAGTWAEYDRTTRTVKCESCADGAETSPSTVTTEPTPAPLETGIAGASARREHRRRVARREERIRTAHPKIGGLILALTDEPQSTTAWARGAVGEERLGKRLDETPGALTLHDRRIPKTKANIDHIVIAPSGVFVIDAKRYKGRPHLRVQGGILRPRVESLIVGTRDCTKLVAGVQKQVDLVKAITDNGAPVRGVLCFVEADWPMLGGSFTIDSVEVLWPKKLSEHLTLPGSLSFDEIIELQRRLGEHFLAA